MPTLELRSLDLTLNLGTLDLNCTMQLLTQALTAKQCSI